MVRKKWQFYRIGGSDEAEEAHEAAHHIATQLANVLEENERDGSPDTHLFNAAIRFFTSVCIAYEVELEDAKRFLAAHYRALMGE